MPDTESDQARRLAFQACVLEEQPKLTNIKSVLASEYFNHGWSACTVNYVNRMLQKRKKLTVDDFNATNLQVAVLTALEGGYLEQEEALGFLRDFINSKQRSRESVLG